MEHDVRFNSKFDSPQVTKWLKNQKVMHTSICQAIQLACSICGDADLPTAITSIKAQQRIQQKQMQANGIQGYPRQPISNIGYVPYPQYQQPYYPMNAAGMPSYSRYQPHSMPSQSSAMPKSYQTAQSFDRRSSANLKVNNHKKNHNHKKIKQKSKKINHNDLGNLFKDLKK